jgi:hypothetical protein
VLEYYRTHHLEKEPSSGGPLKEGPTKSNVKKFDGKGRQGPPPPTPPSRLIKEGDNPPKPKSMK